MRTVEKGVKYVQSKQQKQQNAVINIALVFLLFSLDILQTLFYCFYFYYEQVNVSWVIVYVSNAWHLILGLNLLACAPQNTYEVFKTLKFLKNLSSHLFPLEITNHLVSCFAVYL